MKNQGVSMAGQSENGVRYTEAKYEKICFSCEKPYFPKVGSYKSRDDMQKWLQAWIEQYVDFSADSSSEEEKARKPLAAAEVVIEEDESNPGYYTSKFFLKPHYQLEGLSVSLRLTSKLPSEK